MATTLVQLATDRRDALAQRKQAAFTEFDAARQTLDGPAADLGLAPILRQEPFAPAPLLAKLAEAAAAEGLHKIQDQLTRALAQLNRRIAAARRTLAGELTPAELDARIDALRELIAARVKLRVALLDTEERVALAEGRLERARADHQRLGAGHAAAETGLAEATARAERLQVWDERRAEEPLASLPGRAGEIRTTAPHNEDFDQATQRIEGAIPEPLRVRAIERYDQQLAKLEAVRGAVDDAEGRLAGGSAALTGPAAAVASARAALASAEAALTDFVVRGPDRLEMARGMLAAVAGGPAPTDAESDAITEPDLAAAGEAAAAAEKTRDEALAALAAAEAELESKRLELRAADVDADPDDDPAVPPLQDAVDQAASDLGDAEDAYTPEMRAALDRWEAAVPDALWADLLTLERARRILAALEGTVAADLADAVSTAEEGLVGALEAEAKAVRTVDFLRAAAERRRERLEITETIQERRAASAVRGDR